MGVEKRHLAGAAAVALIGLAALASGSITTRRPRPPELSADRTIAVTTSRDDGGGSLREALFAAASAPERVRIEIRPRRIELQSPLPAIVNPRGVVIDGEASGARIDARRAGATAVLDIASPNTVVAGVTIESAGAQAILVRAAGVRLRNVELIDCAEGVRLMAAAVGVIIEDSVFRRNGIGVVLTDAASALIRRNRFSQHDQAGIWAVTERPRENMVPVQIVSNDFEQDRIGLVAINVPVNVQRNEFRSARESAVYLMGHGALVRQNRVRDGRSVGLFADATEAAVLEDNELDRNAIGVLLRSSRNSVTRRNRIHSNAYGAAVVFGDAASSNVFAENLILNQRYDGFYVVGASPILRSNVAVQNQHAALRVLDFVPRNGPTVVSAPLLRGNRFEANALNEPVRGVYREPEETR